MPSSMTGRPSANMRATAKTANTLVAPLGHFALLLTGSDHLASLLGGKVAGATGLARPDPTMLDEELAGESFDQHRALNNC